MIRAFHVLLPLCLSACSVGSPEIWLPHPIGPVQASGQKEAVVLSNGAIAVSLTGASHTGLHIENRLSPTPESIEVAPFALIYRNGHKVPAEDLRVLAPVAISSIRVDRRSPKAADHYSGKLLEERLLDPKSGIGVTWTAELKDDSNYVRTTVSLTSEQGPTDVARVQLIDARVPGASVVGSVLGSPAASNEWFLGFEHPMSATEVEQDRVTSYIDRKLQLQPKQSVTYSAVVGVAPQGQLRRAFLRYVERERAHPYRTFLHYNSWYDLGYFNRYTAAQGVERIRQFGQELSDKRGVKLSSFLFDDGWDDVDTTWKFNSGFPNGFVPLTQAASQFGAAPGAWLSPWGGYSTPHDKRVAAAKANGFETDSDGLALSGPKYYAHFHDVCTDLLRQGINQFKFDGTGSPDKQYPGSAFASDFEAAIALIGDLRKEKPELFINLTTGTWPSPFWTRYADSIWRGGYDDSVAGVGTKRQQWITYRDGDTYQGIVQQGPLYPLNSLMLHGIIYAQYAGRLKTDPGDDFKSEVRSYFGTGTQLQELYVTPTLLTAKNWDDLAEAAKWARSNADVLKDVRWIGGNPTKLEVYGHAAWNGDKAILVLRNPSNKPQKFPIDIAKALELPAGFFRFSARSPWMEDRAQQPMLFTGGEIQDVGLQPFQVLTLDLRRIK